jgi:hypothetical protein
MLSLALLLALTATEGEPALGGALKQGGFTIKPPRGFRMARMDLFNGTRVGAIAATPNAPRWLAAALVDSDSEEAASMLIGVVEAPFAVGPGARDELSAAAVHHFSNELGLKLAMERAELVVGAAPHVRVLGSVRQGSQLRKILIAAFPGEARHLVITFTAPSGRFDTLEKVFGDSLESVRSEAPSVAAGRTLAWAALALVGSLLAASIGLWRRRLATRR